MAGTWWIGATAPQPTTARRTLEVFGFVMGRLWGNGYAGTAAYVTRGAYGPGSPPPAPPGCPRPGTTPVETPPPPPAAPPPQPTVPGRRSGIRPPPPARSAPPHAGSG